MARRTPRRLAAVIALVIGLGAVVPATSAEATTTAKVKSKGSTTVVVTPQVLDWWF